MDELNRSVNSFMKGKLNESELRNCLIKNNVDPNNYQVFKNIIKYLNEFFLI